jgi:hypothetical protein
MTNAVQFGRQPPKAPAGNFREVHFPQLALLDKGTQEGFLSRILHAEGGSARGLPRTIYFQKGQDAGHMGSVAIGSLHEVTLDPDAGVMSGKGWLADVPEAHDALPFIISKALFHNSVDLAEVKVREELEGKWMDDDFKVNLHFDQWKLAATTFVGKPAFPDAHGIVMDEITAALESTDPVEVWSPLTKIRILVTEDPDAEILASATGLPSWDYFFRPETNPQKIVVTDKNAAGYWEVYGHLGMWESCHDGVEGMCLRIPRPQDNYASFNKAGVLTDKGQVETGPIALFGGHIPLAKAFDDPANAWADVRIIPGVHGPWISGIVRPGTDEDKIYAARASRISGHWKGGRLKAIVSCNAEGYDVPGSGFSINSKGFVDELVASYCGPEPEPKTPIILQGHPEVLDSIRQALTTTTSASMTVIDLSNTTQPEVTVDHEEDGIPENEDFEMEKQRLMLELELEDE